MLPQTMRFFVHLSPPWPQACDVRTARLYPAKTEYGGSGLPILLQINVGDEWTEPRRGFAPSLEITTKVYSCDQQATFKWRRAWPFAVDNT
jgi:hypothetical protein